MKVTRVNDLAVMVAQDPKLAQQIKDDPAGTLAELANPLQTDAIIYRIIVVGLVLAILTALIGGMVLASRRTDIPQLVTALGSGALGAVAGLLAPSPAAS
jgi:hypothetical protein